MDIMLVGNPGPLFDWLRDGIEAAGVPLRRTRLPAEEHLQQARQGRLKLISSFDHPEAACADWRAAPRCLREFSAALFAAAALRGLADVLPVDHETSAATIAADLGIAFTHPPPAPPAADPALRELLAPALIYARTGDRHSQIWPRDILLDGDRPDRPLPRLIDLTGPARTLAYGPYLGFSPGPARLSVMLAVSPNCRHTEMAIELHSTSQLGRGLFVLTQPGLFAAAINVNIPSAREALEIRLKSERGAIEGEIGVDQVKLTPV